MENFFTVNVNKFKFISAKIAISIFLLFLVELKIID